MPRPSRLPPTLDVAFSVRAALEAGVTRDRLRRGDLIAPFYGGRMTRLAPDALDRYDGARASLLELCAAYAAVAPPEYRFSHVTAARLFGMPLPLRLEQRTALDVSVPASSSQPRGSGVIGHRSSESRVRFVSGFPVVPPEVAWIQLATAVSLDDLVIAGDHLIRHKPAVSTVADMRAAVSGMHRMRGALLARAACADVRGGTRSPRESRMRLIIVRSGLPEPVVGHTVIDDDGYFVGTPDLAYVAEKIAIEYEGDDHRSSRQIFQDDIERRERFESAGWRVLRVTDYHIRHQRVLVERVRRLLAERHYTR